METTFLMNLIFKDLLTLGQGARVVPEAVAGTTDLQYQIGKGYLQA